MAYDHYGLVSYKPECWKQFCRAVGIKSSDAVLYMHRYIDAADQEWLLAILESPDIYEEDPVIYMIRPATLTADARIHRTPAKTLILADEDVLPIQILYGAPDPADTRQIVFSTSGPMPEKRRISELNVHANTVHYTFKSEILPFFVPWW